MTTTANTQLLEFSQKAFLSIMQDRKENCVYSPLGFATLTALLWAWQQETGSTKPHPFLNVHKTSAATLSWITQSLDVLHDAIDDDDAFRCVSALWLDKSVSIPDGLKETIANTLKAPISTLPFEKRDRLVKAVSNWCKKATDGLIDPSEDVENLPKETDKVFTNATFFSMQWFWDFDEADTKNRIFYRNHAPRVSVPTMDRYISDARFFENSRLLAVTIELHSDFEMLFVMPKDSKVPLSSFAGHEELSGILDSMKLTKCHVRLPRLNIKTNLQDLGEVLHTLGLGDILENSSSISQSAALELDEYGVKAAAFTMAGACMGQPDFSEPQKVFLNHPFFYAILHWPTKTILFEGFVADPSEEN